MMAAGKNLRLVALLGSLTAFAPLAIDMYLPAFPEMAREYGAGIEEVQRTLVAFLLGLALGQFVYGPLADRWGRRRPLIVGCLMFSVASLGCLMVQSVDGLILWRFIMGLGGSAGAVIVRAVVRDLYDEKGSARMISSIMLVTSLAPLLAPSIGGQLLLFSTWHLIFVLQSVFGLLSAMAVALALPESLPPEQRARESFGVVLSGYGRLLVDRRFLGFTLALGFASGMLFSYVSSSSFVFMELFGLSPQQYGLVFSSIAAALFGAAQLNRFLFRRYTPGQIFRTAYGVNAALTGLLFLSVGLDVGGFWAFYLLIFFSFATLGLVFPTGGASAMAPFSRGAGQAAAFLGASQYLIGAAGSAAAEQFYNGSALPVAGVIAGCSWLGLLAVIWLNRTLKN